MITNPVWTLTHTSKQPEVYGLLAPGGELATYQCDLCGWWRERTEGCNRNWQGCELPLGLASLVAIGGVPKR